MKPHKDAYRMMFKEICYYKGWFPNEQAVNEVFDWFDENFVLENNVADDTASIKHTCDAPLNALSSIKQLLTAADDVCQCFIVKKDINHPTYGTLEWQPWLTDGDMAVLDKLFKAVNEFPQLLNSDPKAQVSDTTEAR